MAIKGIVLLIGLGTVLVAALLTHSERAGAQTVPCWTTGIVPGSVSITSSNNRPNQISGHTVRFQLCPINENQAAAGGHKPPDKVALLWQTYGSWGNRGYFLEDAESAGVTLRQVGTSEKWNVTSDVADWTDRSRRKIDYCSPFRSYYNYAAFQGLAVELPVSAADSGSASEVAWPVTMEFNVPASAGMVNPHWHGDYRWLVVLFSDYANSRQSTLQTVFSSIDQVQRDFSLHLMPHWGPPGAKVKVLGYGFPAFSPVTSVSLGGLEIGPIPPITTDLHGEFEIEALVPGLAPGRVPLEVEVGTTRENAEFRVTDAGGTPDLGKHPDVLIRALGDNFVRVFSYDPRICHWSFFDPRFPEESDLQYLYYGFTYWILVREPVELKEGTSVKNLTCPAEGNCWNQIRW